MGPKVRCIALDVSGGVMMMMMSGLAGGAVQLLKQKVCSIGFFKQTCVPMEPTFCFKSEARLSHCTPASPTYGVQQTARMMGGARACRLRTASAMQAQVCTAGLTAGAMPAGNG